MIPPSKARGGHAKTSTKPTSPTSKTPAWALGDVLDAGSDLERLLVVEEVAGITQLSVRQIRRMIASGALPVVRFGAAVRIRPSVLAALIAGGGR